MVSPLAYAAAFAPMGITVKRGQYSGTLSLVALIQTQMFTVLKVEGLLCLPITTQPLKVYQPLKERDKLLARLSRAASVGFGIRCLTGHQGFARMES